MYKSNLPNIGRRDLLTKVMPVCAASGEVLHFLWIDDIDTNGSVLYSSVTGGIEGTITNPVIIVDERAYQQTKPSIAVNGAKVFACWQDARNVSNNNSDTDIYYVEKTGSDTASNLNGKGS